MAGKALVVSLLSLFLFASVAEDNDVKNAAEDIKDFKGSVVMVDAQVKSFRITIPENPTTGFRWYLSDYDHDLVEPVSSAYQASETQQQGHPIVGAGGNRSFVFHVKPILQHAPQKTKLEFRYERPWASGEKGEKKVITVYSS